MVRFTESSSTAWSGEVSHEAPKRVLDVEVDGAGSRPISIVIGPKREAERLAEPTVEAIVEWGNEQGSSHRVVVDVARGIKLGLSAERLVVQLRRVDELGATKGCFVASANLGTGGHCSAPTRTLSVGPLAAGALSPVLVVPAFASRLAVVRAPALARVEVDLLDARMGPVGALIFRGGEGGYLPLPPAAQHFTVRANSSVRSASAVFELSL